MPGPAPQERKHGRTPNAASEWREYEDVPFEGAPEMPKPPGRKRKWHEMSVRLWDTASVMPHCLDWRDEDWLALEVLMYEMERYYNPGFEEKQTTAQITEIRRQMVALGMGEKGRREQKIRYKQRVEAGLPGAGDQGAHRLVEQSGVTPGGNVVPIGDRRKAILGRGGGGPGEGGTETETG